MTPVQSNAEDVLTRLAQVIESRKPSHGGNVEKSYIARLLDKGPDAFLKKIGEEASELIMSAKDAEHGMPDAQSKIVYETADLWFHCLIALGHFGIKPQLVLDELARREGTSGIEEKALRKAVMREQSEAKP